MATPEYVARIEELMILCDRAIAGEPTEAAAREALRQALSAKGSPFGQATANAYAETLRQEAERRAHMVLALNVSSAAYRAAVTGLRRHLAALLDASQ
jgi:hypothetical protein